MELEEQKPKDIILDQEIKQETDVFLENVKTEPMEEEYFDLIIPNQETGESLENVKTETMEEEYFDLIIPNQETGESLENVKTEPMEEEYFDLIIPNQEAEESLENVKTEPIDDDYSKQFIPKLEEIDEAETSTSEEPSQPTQKNVSSQNRRCSVCFQLNAEHLMKGLSERNHKLIIMVVCVLRGKYSLDQARLIMSKKNSRIYICPHHFSESLNKIYKVLRIEKPEEIASCSDELMNNLMVTVNSICPHIMTSQFCAIVCGNTFKSLGEKQTNFKSRNRFCAACLQSKSNQYAKHVTLVEEKLMIMMGCVLRNDWNLDQAKSFIKGRSRMDICHIHISDAINEIYKFLDIESPEEIDSCSDDLVQILIETVNSICPQIDSTQFRAILYGFVLRNTTRTVKRSITEKFKNQKKKQRNSRCVMCSQLQIRSHTKQVTLEDEKFIIMIGYILRGDYTIEEAKEFLSAKKYVYICYAHLVEVNNEIYNVLQINNPGGIFSCSSELMEKLMITVNAIYSWVATSSFKIFLLDFAVRNKKHLSITI